jgi:quinoprotein glucose dehydrogenase
MIKQVGMLILALAAGASAYKYAPGRPLADAAGGRHEKEADQGWPLAGGQAANDHYSSLAQINRGNVKRLVVAWKFDSGEKGQMQVNPVIVGNVLYAYTPSQKVIALDAATGRLLWKFDPGINGTQPTRGVTYWTNGAGRRLFAGVMNFLYALDPSTGVPIKSFGEDGRIDLRKNLRGDYKAQSIALTSPGVIYKDLIIVGGRNPETQPSPPGDVRAFDVHTGELRWQFHTIPHPGEIGYETWPKDAWMNAGAANNWAGMALDESRGIVYVPTGSAVPDFYGAERLGDDLFANTLLALDAATGKLIWYFQGVHHDIWDRDFPSAPALVTVHRNGKSIDAIAQTTKQGWLFVLDRITGRPLFPVEERKYPPSTMPGEVSSATQPFPLKPAPYSRQRLTEELLTNRTPEAHAWAMKQFRTLVSDGAFVPLRLNRQTVLFPGFDGGAEWGGAAVDTETGVLYVNANDIAATGGLEKDDPSASLGIRIYRDQCAMCHGDDRAGSPPYFPTLIGLDRKLSDAQIAEIIQQGKGRMPSFPNLKDNRLSALLEYVRTGKRTEEKSISAKGHKEDKNDDKKELPQDRIIPNADAKATAGAQYRFTGYRKFYDPDGYPAVAPPWGTLNAINLNTGEYLWKITLGEYPELAAKGMANTGTENYGGPIVTAGGLLFIGATIFDRKIRAFDSHSGKLLWEAELSHAGLATPSTYMSHGKQYVVIAAGGGRNGKDSAGGE